MNYQEFNIASNSKNEIEAGLSNLSHNPFKFNSIEYASIEAFWQSLKFEENSNQWKECINLSGPKSKIFGNKINGENTFIYKGIEYLVGSEKHQQLMKIALKNQLEQNPEKLKLLLSTGNSNLIHKPKKSDGSYYPDSITIPGDMFGKFLMELRLYFSSIEKNVDLHQNKIKNIF